MKNDRKKKMWKKDEINIKRIKKKTRLKKIVTKKKKTRKCQAQKIKDKLIKKLEKEGILKVKKKKL